MRATLKELQGWVEGSRANGAAAFDGVVTDSRNVVPGSLFVALRGERFDAHDFLADVAAKGAAAVVAERIPEGLSVPALIVPDTRLALGEIARHWRRRFILPVIGVTGSNGKTTVKEMIASILSAAFGEENFLATRGNFNNDIGVPLTVFRLAAGHRAAVIELGMNHVGEIAYLASIAQPTVGLVNNAQREHQEFMQSVQAVAEENGAVIRALPESGVAVFPADDPFASLWLGYARETGQRQTVTFGLSADADVTGRYSPSQSGSELVLIMQDREFPVTLTTIGLHNVRNALAAASCCHAIGVEPDAIVRGLESFASVNGRLQRKTAPNGAVIIDDTYNANPDSVLAAIDVLAQAASPRILILGDMGEVGQQGRRFHEEAGEYAKKRGIDHVYTMGQLARHASDTFGNADHADDLATLMKLLEKTITPAATVLVKGSRFMKMERVVHELINQQTREHG
jgi:UDP-N-acetylmuramoyl-tripeptide--D-alanyl-D-alanine ligase